MNNNYARFEASMRETRAYHDEWGKLPGEIREAGIPMSKFQIIDRITDADVSGSHVMNSGIADPITPFKKSFKTAPPVDFCDFYCRWNGGFLLFGLVYRLLPMDRIIAVNMEFREMRGHKPSAPWRIIRFADIGNNDYIGYRLKEDNRVVSLILNEYHDDDLLTGQFEAPVLAGSFSGWIDRLLDLDGAMPGNFPGSMRRTDKSR
jgi:hypothetical protein